MNKLMQALIYIVAGIVLGVGLTFGGQTYFAHKAEVKEQKTVNKENVHAADNANKAESDLLSKLDGAALNSAALRESLNKRLDKPFAQGVIYGKTTGSASVSAVRQSSKTECPTPVVDGDSYMPLDVGSLRLLNAYRSGAPIDSLGLSDAESEAFAFVTVRIFIANDTEIAKMYNDLAARHNSLVDQVADFQAEQRKRLNK